MGNIFAGSEIVEIGIQIEKNGRDFYKVLSGKSKDGKAAGVFGFLAGEEEKHIKAFQDILDKTDKYEPAGIGADDYFAYMNALAGEYVFTQKDKGAEIAESIKSDEEAVTMGIGFEKDSIIFYEGMKKTVPDFDIKLIDSLIAQEQSHLTQLSDLKASILQGEKNG
ncbi:MAG: ferritin family protein [Candidatus Omnitrophica bacterium]|nr:ferritin family protein [Candidatus Omnitrophota bacterium]